MMSFDIHNIRALILDMDGVLWRGKQLIGDLPSIFGDMERKGLKVILASNNSTRTPATYIEKVRSLGVHIEDWQLINSAEATSDYLSRTYPQGGPVYVVGEGGLVASLEAKGFAISAEEAIAVVAGLDRQVDYEKINIAARLIGQGADFIGSNPDRTIPTPNGFAPGAGTILAAIEAAAGTQPRIIGKPEAGIFEMAMQRLDTKPDETLMVGDRLETDILGGQNAGCRTALVLSGVTEREAGERWRPKIDLIANDLSALLEMLLG
jgi:4-nitrophenyl phosphatase